MSMPNDTSSSSLESADQRLPDSPQSGMSSGAGPSDGAPGAGEMARTAKDEASNVASAAADTARTVAGEAATQAKAMATQVTDQVQSLFHEARGELMSQADTKSRQATSGLRTLSGQLSALAEGRTSEAGPLADYLQEARGKVSALASRVENGGPQGVLDDVTGFARRRPALFLLGAAGAGFVIGRIVRSGAAAVSERNDDESASSPSNSLRPALDPARSDTSGIAAETDGLA